MAKPLGVKFADRLEHPLENPIFERLFEMCDEPHRVVDVIPTIFNTEITGHTFFPAAGESLAHIHDAFDVGLLCSSEDTKGIAEYARA